MAAVAVALGVAFAVRFLVDQAPGRWWLILGLVVAAASGWGLLLAAVAKNTYQVSSMGTAMMLIFGFFGRCGFFRCACAVGSEAISTNTTTIAARKNGGLRSPGAVG